MLFITAASMRVRPIATGISIAVYSASLHVVASYPLTLHDGATYVLTPVGCVFTMVDLCVLCILVVVVAVVVVRRSLMACLRDDVAP